MNSVKYIVASALLIACVVSMASAQAVGDYGTTGSGRWGTTGANWVVCQTPGTWVGATPAPGPPTPTTNVWIRAGHSDTVETSGKECANLTVEATGFLVGNQPLPSATIQYLQVFGTTVTVNGVFGSSLSPGTNLALEAATSGATLTLTGSGTFGPARIRVNSDASGVTIVFDINSTLRYTGSTGSGGVALYPQTDNNVFTVNAGKTITCVVNAGLGVSGSNRVSASVNLTMNVYGTINMNSSSSPMTLKVTSGKSVSLTVFAGGTVSVLGGVHTSTVADGGSTVLTVNGAMTAGGPVDFSNPSFVVTGSGTFTLYQTGNLEIGHPEGIAASGATGQIRTTTRSFSSLAKYSYLGAAAQATGTGLPSTVGDLLVDNSSGVTLTSGATINDSLILMDGNIITGANTLALAATGIVDRTAGHVVGNLQKNVATGTAVARTYEIGTASNYVPLTVTFANVTTAGNLVASTTAGDHPNLASGNINTAKSVNRYWTLTNSGVGFGSFDAVFDFLPSELDPGSSPGVFIVERYSGGVWSGLTEGQRTSTSTRIVGATAFGDFAIGEDETAAPAPAFELSSWNLGLGAVRIGFTRADTAWVRNIGSATLDVSSILSSNTPVFTVTPGSALVASHDSALVAVTFAPSGTGAAQANIVFAHNAVGSPDTLAVTGYGTVGAVQSNGTGGGDWGAAGTWQGGLIPTNFDTVVVLGSDSVWVPADTSCASLTLQAGGRIGLFAELGVGGATVGGTVVARTGGVLVVEDTSSFQGTAVYEHARNAGDFPNHVRWLTGSTAKFTGIQDTVPDNSSQSFHHVVWDCPNQAGANLNTGWDSITIGGDITVLNTGASGRWQMAAPVTNDSSTFTILGNIFQSGGSFTTNGTGNAGTRITIHHYGNINVTGGNFSVSRGSQGGTGTTRWYLHAGDFSMANATTQNSNAAGARFVFAKPGTQNLLLGSGNTLTALPFEVSGGATLNAGTSVVRGSGLVMVDAGATVRSAHPGGFDSTFAGSGTRTLDPASNYVLDGSVLQKTGRRMADTLNNLTIANSAGVVLSDSILVNGTVTLSSGDLDLSGKLITLGPSALLSETFGNTVKGSLGRITATRTLNAPAVGTNIAGLGIGIGSSANLGSTVIVRGHTVQSLIGSYGIARYFDIVPTNNAGLNATLRFLYDDSELGYAGEPTLQLHQSTDGGATWAAAGGSLNTSTNLIEVSGQNSLARWTAAGEYCVNVPYTAGWNMISNPITTPNDSVLQLFPASAFNYVFGFGSTGYSQSRRMITGAGYWAKFLASGAQLVCEAPLLLDTVDVAPGWNMIGSISVPVDTGAILQIPAGTITSRYFGYLLGYNETATIVPGSGYWAKAGAAGRLVLSGSLTAKPAAKPADPLEGFARVTVADNNGASQTLYLGKGFAKPAMLEFFELPPQGPEGVFDVRFASGRSVELVCGGEPSRHTIAVSSASYPLRVSWNVGGDLNLTLTAGDAEARAMTGEGELIVSGPHIRTLLISSESGDVPREFSLGQNYPNPFNPSTTIMVGLPVQAHVSVRVYNLLGQKVADVATGTLAAGYHKLVWNGKLGSGLEASSGVYFYRIDASSSVDGQKFVEARKMMLMK